MSDNREAETEAFVQKQIDHFRELVGIANDMRDESAMSNQWVLRTAAEDIARFRSQVSFLESRLATAERKEDEARESLARSEQAVKFGSTEQAALLDRYRAAIMRVRVWTDHPFREGDLTARQYAAVSDAVRIILGEFATGELP